MVVLPVFGRVLAPLHFRREDPSLLKNVFAPTQQEPMPTPLGGLAVRPVGGFVVARRTRQSRTTPWALPRLCQSPDGLVAAKAITPASIQPTCAQVPIV